MATQNSNFGTFANAARNAGNQAWVTPSNAQTSNNTRTTSGGSFGIGSDNSQNLRATAPSGLTIPSGATIDGIRVSIERRYIDGGEGLTASDQEVYIIKGGTVRTVQNKASGTAWPSSDGTATYGGASDLWGLTWLDTDFGSDFGVQLVAKTNIVPEESLISWEVDHIFVDVYYTEAVSGASGRARLLMGVG